MKKISRFVFPLVVLLAAATAAYAGHEYPLTPSSMVPATTGTLKIDQDNNKNTTIELKVKHLAKPENLSPPQSTYVVWIQSSGGQPENAGQLRVGDNLDAEFRTTTPYKKLEVLVTAESGPNPTSPSGMVVLRQEISE